MKSRLGRCLILFLLCGTSLVQGAVESLLVSGAATGVDIAPEDGFLDWYDNHLGWVGDDRNTTYRTAVQFSLTVPPRATINSALLIINITNSGGIRQAEVNVIKGDGGVGFGAMLIKGLAERWTVAATGTSTLKLDVTSLMSSLVSTGAAFVDFNVNEVPANTNNDKPMTLELAGAEAPELLVDYTSAGPPAGHYQYQLGTGHGPMLWDFGGSLGGDFEQHANGKLTAFSGAGIVKGNVTGISVRFAFKEQNGNSSSDRYAFVLLLDPAARTLTGTEVHRSVTVSCDTIIGPCHRYVTVDTSQVSIALPEANDGSWTLDLAITRNSARISGNAFLTFPNGDVFQFRVRGKYLEKLQKANLILSGAGANTGTMLLLSITVPDMTIESMRGRIAGQKIDWHL